MSYSTIIHIWPGEKIAYGEELRNSHGSAPVVWDALAQRYLGMRPFAWGEAGDALWQLYKRPDLPLHLRAVLMMTFDRAYVKQSDYQRAASDVRAFLKDFPAQSGYANHWERIAQIYEASTVPAIGIYHTSVSENPFEGEWNEEKEAHEPVDWTTCYDLYATLDEVRASESSPHTSRETAVPHPVDGGTETR